MTEEELAVLEAYEAMQQAMVDKDVDAMRQLTTEDKTFTHMSGKTQTREEFFGEIADGTLNYYGYRIRDPHVTVEGDRATLTGSVNVINNLSLDCDCDGSAGAPVMGDIGILASLDPVALDRASLDQIYLSDDPGKDAMIARIESHDGAHLLDYAESLGLGQQAYELIPV